MSLTPIMNGLERSGATGAEAEAVARLGFLEWVFGYPGAVTAGVVREALAEPAVRNADSAAARAFARVLEEARHAAPMTRGRRGRAARVVH
ncbi:hypothetical protein FIU89_06715 [Roseovarius sp. THAF27]|uniref:hypothetical protein n=1 Tax=unclassified Roseovarius TaxID=2614913 RepID=UPI0012A98A03|nr:MULTISPECIES: hypothetical protein [unclassified Roseovarius]QFT80298.1 hypothetical protein FIU89_06715 [Roseovarius sp. THAF27]QFT96574.1 hypothetical protein FIU85_04605 [Roseovarius sp. THAF8]